jgi:N-acetyl-alpha-D-muramate 1-phosphate uridylyltransferase
MNNPSTSITRAMILAAGLGTRFKPWTDEHPKALAPVNGKSLLQRNIEYLQQFGIRDVVINVHHFADQIIDALTAHQGWGSHFTISDETDEVLETGGGLKKASSLLQDSPFVLMNVDILTDMNLYGMMTEHFRYRPLATLAVTDRTTSRYFLFDGQQQLCGWRNVQTGQERMARPAEVAIGADGHRSLIEKAFSGIHIIDPALIPLIRQEGKFSVVDVYLTLAAGYPIRGYDHSQSKLIDVGRPESVEQASQLFA